ARAKGARILASLLAGSSNERRGKVSLLSADVAHAQTHVCPTTKCGIAKPRNRRTAQSASHTAMTTKIDSAASRPAAAPAMLKRAPTTTPGKTCNGAQTIAERMFAA